MDANFFLQNPFRPPQWRANRVLQMLEHRPKPLRPRAFDDHYVQTYRRFLQSYLIAGLDEEARQAVKLDQPHMYHAHFFHFGPDREWSQILQAFLLTTESLDEIANRFGTKPAAIDYYEKIFFNVRHRLQARDWIAKVILEIELPHRNLNMIPFRE